LSPPRRVSFDAVRALRNTTGLGNYSRGVLRALHDAAPRLELYLLTSRPPRAEFSEFPAELGARVIRPRRWGALAPGLWRTWRAGCCAASYGVDVYHGLSHEIPRDLPRTGVPSVVTFHDLIYRRHAELFPIVDRWSYRWRYDWSARHADAIIAVSTRTRDNLLEDFRIDPARVTVIPPPRHPAFGAMATAGEREIARSRYGLPSEYLLSVGTLEPRKNHGVLLAAIAQLGRGNSMPLVLIGGDGGTESMLRTATRARGLGDRVHICRDVAAADLPAVMQGATLFLYPSIIEGFGMPIVEALSAGIPVVAASGGHLDDAGGPGTRYVSPGDPAAWAAAIGELLGAPAMRNQMRNDGVEYARRFDGNKVAASILAVYDAVMTRKAMAA
jgi:glycosyltransferase involved in cell wall biosynthesis